jgi:hypothetical protein
MITLDEHLTPDPSEELRSYLDFIQNLKSIVSNRSKSLHITISNESVRPAFNTKGAGGADSLFPRMRTERPSLQAPFPERTVLIKAASLAGTVFAPLKGAIMLMCSCRLETTSRCTGQGHGVCKEGEDTRP